MSNENQDPIALAKQTIDDLVAQCLLAVAGRQAVSGSDLEHDDLTTEADDTKRQATAELLAAGAEKMLLSVGIAFSENEMQVVDGKVTFCGTLKKELDAYAWDKAAVIAKYRGMLARRETIGSVADAPH